MTSNAHLSQAISHIRGCLFWGVVTFTSEYSVSKDSNARWLSQYVGEARVLWVAKLFDEIKISPWLRWPCLHNLPHFPYQLMCGWMYYVITNPPHVTIHAELVVLWLSFAHHAPSQSMPSESCLEPVFGYWPCKWAKWEQWQCLASWAAQCEDPRTAKQLFIMKILTYLVIT